MWRRSRVDRPWARLRRNHSSLPNRLAGNGLCRSRGRRCLCSCCRGRSSRRLLRRGWRGWSGRRMYGWSYDNCGRCRRFFNRRRRHHGRRCRLDYGRCDHNTSFRCRCSRFRANGSGLLRHWRRRRSGCFHRYYRGRGLGGNSRRPGWRSGRLVLFLLFLLEQPHYVAGLGDLGKVDLRLDLGCGCSLSRGRTGLGGKMLAYLFRFVLLNGA